MHHKLLLFRGLRLEKLLSVVKECRKPAALFAAFFAVFGLGLGLGGVLFGTSFLAISAQPIVFCLLLALTFLSGASYEWFRNRSFLRYEAPRVGVVYHASGNRGGKSVLAKMAVPPVEDLDGEAARSFERFWPWPSFKAPEITGFEEAMARCNEELDRPVVSIPGLDIQEVPESVLPASVRGLCFVRKPTGVPGVVAVVRKDSIQFPAKEGESHEG